MLSEPSVMQWQLVGRGNVIVLTMPGDGSPGQAGGVSVAISDASFVEAIEKLLAQARHHPDSMLLKLRVQALS